MRVLGLIIGAVAVSACAHHVKQVDCERQLQPINLELPLPAPPDVAPVATIPPVPGEAQP